MRTVVSLKDLLSEEGRHDPYPFYAELHRLGQACPLDPAADRYCVAVHGYEAVERVMKDPMFLMLDGDYLDRRQGQLWRRRPALRTLQGTIFFANPPDHTRMRRPLAQVFTARRVAALEPAIARLIERRLDRLADLGAGGQPVNFITEFATPLPSDVIGELLGVPEADRDFFPERSATFSAILEMGPHVWRHLAAADAAAGELSDYFADLIAKRRAEPRDDLVSAVVTVQASTPGQFSDAELVANLIGLFNGGFLTTTHLIGNGLMLLLERPEARAEMVDRPELAPAFVEEILRYRTPVHFGVRWASADTEVMGVPVPAGGEALVLMGAANRDPRRFADPDVFDATRPNNHPMSFSVGPHYCLGAALSRLEVRLALPMVLRRFPELALTGAPRTLDQLMFHGYESIPIAVA